MTTPIDLNITLNYGGGRCMEPIIKTGAGIKTNEGYLFKHYGRLVNQCGALLHLSVELQNQRDEALQSLSDAQDRIEEMEEALAHVEAARLRRGAA